VAFPFSGRQKTSETGAAGSRIALVGAGAATSATVGPPILVAGFSNLGQQKASGNGTQIPKAISPESIAVIKERPDNWFGKVRTGTITGMTFEVAINFHGDLACFFLRRKWRGLSPVIRILHEKSAVKDVIEACGIPHPEVDLILINSSNEDSGLCVDFGWQIQTSTRIDVYGFPAPQKLLPLCPRLQARCFERFVADGHLGELARNLRLLGLDTAYEPLANDPRLLELMSGEDRAILTRDRCLLMHSIVQHGFCPRSSDPERQTIEVLHRFGLSGPSGPVQPFTRCLECNGRLATTRKEHVSGRLAAEPRTLLYYDDYRTCTTCGRIYWAGSHFAKLAERVSRLVPS
jgi:uncharacterized protein